MVLTKQVAFLNTIIESSREYSIIAKDLAGTILAWNEGARRIYGYETSDDDDLSVGFSAWMPSNFWLAFENRAKL